MFNYQQRNAAPIIATGSGVLISQDGYIVTNNHVVQDALKVEVTLNDKRSYTAEIIGTDPSSDLALLKIDASGLPYLTYGNSDECKIGEWVLAVGNPLNLTSTVTAGIISAKARNINIIPDTDSGNAIESFIQTDAAVNAGNSGGALVNTKGELIGINTAIASGTGYYAGYSFAVPVNIVKKVIGDIKSYGKVQRALLGVSINDINSDFASKEGLNTLKGAYVNGMSSMGEAEKAGIKVGDVITAIDGKDINSTSELLERVSQYSPEETVFVTVNRGGKVMDFDVKLSNPNKSQTTQLSGTKDNITGCIFLDAKNEDLIKYNSKNGVIVVKVNDGVFKSAGIQTGFLITKVDNVAIRSVSQLLDILSSKRGGVLVEGKYGNGVKAYYGIGL